MQILCHTSMWQYDVSGSTLTWWYTAAAENIQNNYFLNQPLLDQTENINVARLALKRIIMNKLWQFTYSHWNYINPASKENV